MGGLVLKLRAHEEVLVNGVVMRNGDRNVRLVVKSPDAHILRLSEALQPEEAATPVSRLCFLAQQVVAGQCPGEAAAPKLLRGLADLRAALGSDCDLGHLTDAQTALEEGKFYGAFRALKRMIPVEANLLGKSGLPA
ncbi:MAG: flagellar biosynthesis repressor FlbT [Pseudomonadota bacterium]